MLIINSYCPSMTIFLLDLSYFIEIYMLNFSLKLTLDVMYRYMAIGVLSFRYHP